jgi:hypothetical protein
LWDLGPTQTGFFVCAKTTKRAEDFLLTAVPCYFRLSLPDFSPEARTRMEGECYLLGCTYFRSRCRQGEYHAIERERKRENRSYSRCDECVTRSIGSTLNVHHVMAKRTKLCLLATGNSIRNQASLLRFRNIQIYCGRRYTWSKYSRRLCLLVSTSNVSRDPHSAVSRPSATPKAPTSPFEFCHRTPAIPPSSPHLRRHPEH